MSWGAVIVYQGRRCPAIPALRAASFLASVTLGGSSAWKREALAPVLERWSLALSFVMAWIMTVMNRWMRALGWVSPVSWV